jgi:hypothetical protein
MMRGRPFHRAGNRVHALQLLAIRAGLVLLALAAATSGAAALPAFAEQTSQPCTACHVGGFGPQLTPMGREFKLEGYTMRAGATFTAPVSAMAVASFVNTAKDQVPPPAPHYATNNNVSLDQANIFVAGGIGEHFGGFSQFTYDGVGRAFAWDNLDVRAVDRATIFGSDVLYGISFNNSPSVEDVWNTLPAWGFTYTSSSLAPSPAAAPLLDGAFAQTLLGTTAYTWWDMSYYAEAGLYWMPSHEFLNAMGAGASDILDGVAPYFRVAYQKDYGDQNFEVGAFAFFPDQFPGGDRSKGSDRYSDLGVDASYQYIGDNNDIYQVNARYIYEHQGLRASMLLGNSSRAADFLNEVKLDGSYYWHNELGGTVSLFDTWGSKDSLLYSGNTALRPDSQGVLFQIDATPFGTHPSFLGPRFNVRVGIQYTVYTRFDGGSRNFDGSGRNASDNDTLRIFTWFAF